MEADQRPWISSEVTGLSPLARDDKGLHLTVQAEIENLGKTPATNVGFDAAIMPINTGYRGDDGKLVSGTNAGDELKKFCAKQASIFVSFKTATITIEPWGFTVFPTKKVREGIGIIGNVTDFNAKGTHAGDGTVVILLLACTIYGTASDKSVHQTGLVYVLDEFGANGESNGINIDKLPVAPPVLRYSRFIPSPGFAN